MKFLKSLIASLVVSLVSAEPAYKISKKEFIYEKTSFPSCHASTIVETDEGFVTAWFGGTHEKHPDVCIWLSRNMNGSWTPPERVADGIQADGTRHPCWNPVLCQSDKSTLRLFYKVGPDPKSWWGMVKTSRDCGKTWSVAEKLPEHILGPIKNKPVLCKNGDWVSPSSTEDAGWRIHFEYSQDSMISWKRTLPFNHSKHQVIQPTLLTLSDDSLLAVCRSRSGAILFTQCIDYPNKWTELAPISLPNPNSGIDALTINDGSHLLVYNHCIKGRSPINLAWSEDGKKWQTLMELEADDGAEFSYPAMIQSKTGEIHITYTWHRKRIRHIVLRHEL